MHHWQTYVGPVELMLQGGYLLWDTPSQYGFLNTIFIYLMPFDDPWMKLYYLNSLLTLSFSIKLMTDTANPSPHLLAPFASMANSWGLKSSIFFSI